LKKLLHLSHADNNNHRPTAPPLDYRSVFVLLQQLPEALADQYKLQQSSKKRTNEERRRDVSEESENEAGT